MMKVIKWHKNIKDYILDTLKLKGYVFEDKIQTRFDIYDTNSGWTMDG